jgi:hypothetical protein
MLTPQVKGAKDRFGSEPVNESGAPERAFQAVRIEAQSAAAARATASICNDARRRLGRTSGCVGFVHRLSGGPGGYLAIY